MMAAHSLVDAWQFSWIVAGPYHSNPTTWNTINTCINYRLPNRKRGGGVTLIQGFSNSGNPRGGILELRGMGRGNNYRMTYSNCWNIICISHGMHLLSLGKRRRFALTHSVAVRNRTNPNTNGWEWVTWAKKKKDGMAERRKSPAFKKGRGWISWRKL